MFSTFGLWDLILIIGVCAQTTALTYAHNPRHKAFIYGLPVPFTFAALAVGRHIDATNVFGAVLLLMYTQVVRVLYNQFGWPIFLAIPAGLAAYSGLALPLAAVLPKDEASFWVSAIACMVFAVACLKYMPERDEPGHRTPMPVWIKLPIIIAVVMALVCIKKWMHGFTTAFPMVGVVGAYEARHSLWTLGRQVPIVMLTVVPMMMTWHVLQPLYGLMIAVVVSWLVFGLAIAIVSMVLKRVRVEDVAATGAGQLVSEH